MKTGFSIVMGLTMVVALVTRMQADEKKEVTLKGTILCTKCELKETEKCGNAIRVKDGEKEAIYYLDDAGVKAEYHAQFCEGPREGSVKGIVTEKAGKRFIKPSKDGVKFDDK